MALSTRPYKGARDFYPETKRLQKYMFDTWRRVCEKFGYEEYDAPILEPTELYLAKGNQEIIDNQTYTFEDRGGRQVTIRTEMTPTVSRMVAGRRQELIYPLRWYSIPNFWRYERTQRGRLREFWQLNVDIFGVETMAAEFELLQLIDSAFTEFGATRDMYRLSLNHRGLIQYLLVDYLGLDDKAQKAVIGLIDRLHKMERSAFIAKLDKLLTPAQRETGVTEKLLALLDARTISELPPEIQEQPATKELGSLLQQLERAGITNVCFDASLMRGFDYYTGIVFEAFDIHPDNNRSMLGGGRYDGLVGLFGVPPVPTVGFGWGDVTLANFLEANYLIPELPSETHVVVVLIGDLAAAAQPVLAELRAAGLNAAMDLSGKKLGDQLKAASKRGVQWVLILGEDELQQNSFKLKNLQTGDELSGPISQLAQHIQTN